MNFNELLGVLRKDKYIKQTLPLKDFTKILTEKDFLDLFSALESNQMVKTLDLNGVTVAKLEDPDKKFVLPKYLETVNWSGDRIFETLKHIPTFAYYANPEHLDPQELVSLNALLTEERQQLYKHIGSLESKTYRDTGTQVAIPEPLQCNSGTRNPWLGVRRAEAAGKAPKPKGPLGSPHYNALTIVTGNEINPTTPPHKLK
jgi:hypothetical protein